MKQNAQAAMNYAEKNIHSVYKWHFKQLQIHLHNNLIPLTCV